MTLFEGFGKSDRGQQLAVLVSLDLLARPTHTRRIRGRRHSRMGLAGLRLRQAVAFGGARFSNT